MKLSHYKSTLYFYCHTFFYQNIIYRVCFLHTLLVRILQEDKPASRHTPIGAVIRVTNAINLGVELMTLVAAGKRSGHICITPTIYLS